MTQESGLLAVDKQSGMTSHDVVAKLRKRFSTKRVGHAGTLDPMATGVLIIGINNATKFLQYIVAGKKRYLATIRLGISTITDDVEGEVIARKEWFQVSDDQIRENLAKFVGKLMQVPSSVSAMKIMGERAYDLVRQGREVVLEPREITIYSLDVLEINRNDHLDIKIDVTCSAGTYIRAIARDLGERLQVGGHLIELRRTEVAPFTIADCKDWESADLIPLAVAMEKTMPSRRLSFEDVAELRFGRQIEKSNFEGPGIGISPSGEVVAILENRLGRAQPISVFNS